MLTIIINNDFMTQPHKNVDKTNTCSLKLIKVAANQTGIVGRFYYTPADYD